jgi:hypothetical protein
MDELRRILEEQRKEMESVIADAEKGCRRKTEGRLRITHNKGTVQYFLRTGPQDKPGRYISKKELEIACEIAQKDYLLKLRHIAEKKQKALTAFIGTYFSEKLEDVYSGLSPDRRSIVMPYRLTDDEYAMQWQDTKFPVFYQPESGEPEDTSGIYTEKNEHVRSKSEKILADKLNLMHIPYHYEKPLRLHGYGIVHPDFTILNKRTRKEYYWEHLGMMDDASYSEKAVMKIETYEKKQHIPGRWPYSDI